MLASDPPPMKYKYIVKKKDFSKVSFEGTTILAPLQKRKYLCPIFDGIGVIQALVYVKESYQKISKKLAYSDELAFDVWELCLGDSALDH